MTVKVFTLEQANRVLPVVEGSIRFIRAKAQEVIRTQDRLTVLALIGGDKPGSPEHGELEKKDRELKELVSAYNKRLEDLAGIGCVVKDLNHGLVDFYTRNGDRLVFLCWRLGEKIISHWHELEGGFSGRRPVGELLEEGEEADDA